MDIFARSIAKIRAWQVRAVFFLGNPQPQAYNKNLMKINTFAAADKQTQILELLKYGTVMAFVDSRRAGVIVPDYLKGDYQLRLNFDYAFDIDDFRVLPDRLEASLSFNHKNFFCVIPFDAVYLILNNSIQRAALFVESVPTEMMDILTATGEQEQAKPSRLKSVAPETGGQRAEALPQQASATAPESSSAAPQPDAAKDKAKKRGHLRVVK